VAEIRRAQAAVYRQAYGSLGYRISTLPFGLSNDPFYGFPLHTTQGTSVVDTIYDSSAIFEPGVQMIRIRGLAMRTWSPFSGCDAQLPALQVWLYKRTGPLVPITSGLAGIAAPPTGGTLVAQNVNVPVFTPGWLARRWDTWPIIIPFSQLFDLASGEHLGVWIQFGSLPAGCFVSVDAADDLAGSPYGSNQTGGSGPTEGRAVIMGLLEGEPRTLSPQLEVYGWPQLGYKVLFQVRQAGTSTPPPNVTVYLGWTNPNQLVGSCRVLSMADILSLGPVTASSMGDATVPFTIPNDPALLHRHVFVQAATSLGPLLSNGLRLTIGGVVP
jgi:hypothetical protein